MWPVRRLWKRIKLAAAFLSFLLLIFLFSYGVFYLFDKQLVGGLVRHQNSRRRDGPLAPLKQDLLPADIFPDADDSQVQSGPLISEGDARELNYNVHIFYYGW
jgi:hypothetical protein